MGLHTHDHDHGHDHHHDHPLIIPSYQWKLCLAVFSISYQESLSLYDFCF